MARPIPSREPISCVNGLFFTKCLMVRATTAIATTVTEIVTDLVKAKVTT
jgi:hypothetical protein